MIFNEFSKGGTRLRRKFPNRNEVMVERSTMGKYKSWKMEAAYVMALGIKSLQPKQHKQVGRHALWYGEREGSNIWK